VTGWLHHLVVLPVLLPLAAAALLLVLDERRRALKNAVAIGVVLALVAFAVVLLDAADTHAAEGPGAALVYILGDWPAPFGIVLVLDRLSAMMLLLTGVLGAAALVFSLARWERAGPRFHTPFLLLLMGLNGAFLTGDLFNLFVFFEVLLAASYGLVLHGSGTQRVKAALHYIAVNLATSLLFLIGVSLIYSVTGTLNMADLAQRIPTVPAEDLALLEAGAAILGIAFLVKAGMWPLCLWLPRTYEAASAPVAAVFAIMSKVGIYVILRVSLLLFGESAVGLAHFADDWLLFGGIATIAFGSIGVLSTRSLPRLAAFSVLISSGTLLGAIGTGDATVLGGALFYLVSSTLAIGALFLLAELVERGREPAAPAAAPVFADEYQGGFADEETVEEDEVGVVIPATIAILGGGLILCASILAGLPPLSGFIAKFAIMAGILGAGVIEGSDWTLVAVITLSGLATLIAIMRLGVNAFWTQSDLPPPQVRVVEAMPIVFLLSLALLLTIQGGAAMRYIEATAQWLHAPRFYAEAVLSTPRRGPATGDAER
jgi:multicomponent K+:H+ antiporter subunit D